MGWLINWDKSKLIPTQSITWLGIQWSTTDSSLFLAPENARNTLNLIRRCAFSKTLSRRQCESLHGSLNFASSALPLGRLKHRRLSREGTTRSQGVATQIPYPKGHFHQVRYGQLDRRLLHQEAGDGQVRAPPDPLGGNLLAGLSGLDAQRLTPYLQETVPVLLEKIPDERHTSSFF
ncbi:hypothetical protein Pmani_007711 [Petrolisthes manimaculis]|uniref:Uncharacterized protein n=1 Tax=Petrolisthes manimaculis TaxID=1843537 RepID=A0AAE1Q737_9EUCA|nr:hypothetical protein Pmani_007711 [Petrolisthes manimaculis]